MYQFFFFKQKTAYELRISDWSSDVCSSDLTGVREIDIDHVADRKRSIAVDKHARKRDIVNPDGYNVGCMRALDFEFQLATRGEPLPEDASGAWRDRKRTRVNSSH